ncbi:MAG: Ig-like domain-containing protein [Weeksellaceae bacterium]
MDKKLTGFFILFLLAFIGFISYMFLNEPIGRLTRASESTEPSSTESLIFAWPLQLAADGAAETEVTVFVRNTEGEGVPEQTVTLSTTVGTVVESQLVTDTEGKALFHISSAQPGVAAITASVNNQPLNRTVTVQFD